ncbi:hypothetical protein HZB97_03180, partial [Candidatus Gottesmanbacteria bacterium]|nr:hypothetical protein [Candidatus Gottesmanbacteria bacterium]
MLTKALFVDFKESDIAPQYFARIKKLFKSVQFISRDDPRLLSQLKDAEIILCKISTKIDKGVINAASKLKYVGVCSTAFDAIEAKYARSKNITVCNLGGYSTEAVAEFFFATLFEQIRELERAKQQARKEDYFFDKFMGIELKNRTLGVVGAGKIGSRIAEIGLGIGMKVIYFSRKNKPEIERLGAEKKNLDRVLSESDFVSSNLALNKETEGIISKKKINLLKKNCIFINLAPPKLIDQEAMMEKAAKGEIIFIFDHSDDIESSLAKRFLKTKNCIVYPPVAFRTEEVNTARWETFVSNIENFVKGKPQ